MPTPLSVKISAVQFLLPMSLVFQCLHWEDFMEHGLYSSSFKSTTREPKPHENPVISLLKQQNPWTSSTSQDSWLPYYKVLAYRTMIYILSVLQRPKVTTWNTQILSISNSYDLIPLFFCFTYLYSHCFDVVICKSCHPFNLQISKR